MEHVAELRKRLFKIAASVTVFSIAAYFVQQHIVSWLLAPAKNQQFIYTTPGGGIDFLFRVCIYTGVVCSLPVIVHQLLKYLQPLIKNDATRILRWGSICSAVLAIAGIAFGYYFGLPAALHFLLNQFTNTKIEALLSIQSYMSFVTLYMAGSALLFQIPLILLLINRIKPLSPKKLLSHERWVVLGAVIAGGIINPSPNITDQLMLAVPMILTYQIGVFLVWYVNRKGTPASIKALRKQDDSARESRLQAFYSARQTAPNQGHVVIAEPLPSQVADNINLGTSLLHHLQMPDDTVIEKPAPVRRATATAAVPARVPVMPRQMPAPAVRRPTTRIIPLQVAEEPALATIQPQSTPIVPARLSIPIIAPADPGPAVIPSQPRRISVTMLDNSGQTELQSA
jgi:sec-independent protein translocase protein TatC